MVIVLLKFMYGKFSGDQIYYYISNLTALYYLSQIHCGVLSND